MPESSEISSELKAAPQSYEEAFAQLNNIVKTLESNQLDLKTALELTAKAKDLSAYCRSQLQEAQKQLEELQGD
ncbi:MAG: exodeoxyribonuclease VII small subunit [bacterium]|jgi:exodeoxyribonuclease VII small subunit|nr:exodeoxyribonuclease VII small subunit [bacterium]